mmetsp:Transcript_27210/g.75064  ORF Transcript_27210/g.75064 Transcript_27210/m.75064 type:complete len:333 (+) Transcript_27210:352-1350(+)
MRQWIIQGKILQGIFQSFHRHGGLLRDQEWRAFATDRGGVDKQGMHIGQARNDKLGIHQHLIRNAAETTSPRTPRKGRLGNFQQRRVGNVELHIVHGQQASVLFHNAIFGLGQNVAQIVQTQPLRRHDNGEPSDKFWNHSIIAQVLWNGGFKVFSLDLLLCIGNGRFVVIVVVSIVIIVVEQCRLFERCSKSNGCGIHASINDPFQARVGSSANKEDIGGVNLQEFVARILATGVLGHINDGSFHNFEQRMLHPFTRNVSRNGDISSRFSNLVNFVNVDNALLGAFDVVSRFDVQLVENAFHVFSDVTRLGETGGIGNDERGVHELGQRFDQ